MSAAPDLTSEVREILEPGQAALVEGETVTTGALTTLTDLLGRMQADQRAFQAAMLAQHAAQHAEMLAALAPLVMRQSGL